MNAFLGYIFLFLAVISTGFAVAPAVAVVAAIASAAVGLLPRHALLAWGVVAFAMLQAMLGETLRFPDWIDGLSPFWHLPSIPGEPWSGLPGGIELTVAAGLMSIGLWGHRRRDIGAA